MRRVRQLTHARPPAHRLLVTQEEEERRVTALLAADGEVGATMAKTLAAVVQREAELRAVEAERAALAQQMRAFSDKGGGVMLTLDELSGDVEALEALRTNLDFVRQALRLKREADPWQEVTALRNMLVSTACGTALQPVLRARVRALIAELRVALCDDLAAAAKDLGWPKPVDIPPSVLRATDGVMASWIESMAASEKGGKREGSEAGMAADKTRTQEQRLQRVCCALARLTRLQLLSHECLPPPEQDGKQGRTAT